MYSRVKEAFQSKAAKVFIIVAVASLIYCILPASMPEAAQRVSFIFIIAALLWAFEVIPLYETSILVVILEIFLLCRPGGIMGMDQTGYKIFLLPFGSPVIILFFGGFVMARAMHKHKLDIEIAKKIIHFFGHKHLSLLFGFMFVTAFLSMWMSNTATTAMMIAMVLPLLKHLDEDDGYRKMLILAIPFAANIGGMGTPIGTPPNAIAIGILADYGIYINFISWMKLAVPLVVILLGIVSFFLYVSIPYKKQKLNFDLGPAPRVDYGMKMTAIIVMVTILLWLSSGIHKIPSAAIALLAVGLFSLAGLLSRDDFKSLDWDILILMWGGLALGKGLEVSGLAQWIIELPVFSQEGFILVAVFSLLAVCLSTFMSNTATSNLLIPIVMFIPGENAVLLATTVALCCSIAMAMPISTPPNAIAFSTNMIKSKDMLKAGLVVSAISFIIILSNYKFVITKALGLD